MNNDNICFMPAYEMAEKLRSQELTSLEITEALIERIEKVNPIINAYCTTTFELARKMARKADNRISEGKASGILNGIPLSIKDLVPTKGIRTTYGSLIFENHIPEEDAIVVKRLKEAGCVILGKTNTPEFGAKGVTNNPIFGETKNPWNLNKTSGGSSGGAAAATVSGISPLAQGSDGGGSIRHPAGLCGAYGIKPHHGRVPIYPVMGLGGETFSCLGPITRHVKDAALLLDAMKGPHIADRYSLPSDDISYFEEVDKIPEKLRVGYSVDLGYAKLIDAEVKKNFFNSIEKLKSYDWTFKEVKIRLRKPHISYLTYHTAMPAFDLKPLLKEWKHKIDKELIKMVNAALSYTGMDIMRAMDIRTKIYNTIFPIFKNHDILLTPTVATTAFDLGMLYPTEINGKAAAPLSWMPYTYIFNLTGHPAATIPSGFSSEHLPFSLQIIGNRFDEITVFQVSRAFEMINSWQDVKPKLQTW